jgi:hypothetical protein
MAFGNALGNSIVNTIKVARVNSDLDDMMDENPELFGFDKAAGAAENEGATTLRGALAQQDALLQQALLDDGQSPVPRSGLREELANQGIQLPGDINSEELYAYEDTRSFAPLGFDNPSLSVSDRLTLHWMSKTPEETHISDFFEGDSEAKPLRRRTWAQEVGMKLFWEPIGNVYATATGGDWNPATGGYVTKADKQVAVVETLATVVTAGMPRLAGQGVKLIGVPVTRSSNPLDTVLDLDAHGNEIMYRTMSEKQFRIFEETGQLPFTGETSISPLLEYSSKYDGVTVKITTQSGTSAQLQEIGIAANKPAAVELPHLSTQTGKWNQTNARFKVEQDQMTTQLGQGKALEIFNENIIDFERVEKKGL